MPQDGHGSPNRGGHEHSGNPSARCVPKPSAAGVSIHAIPSSPPVAAATTKATTRRRRTSLGSIANARAADRALVSGNGWVGGRSESAVMAASVAAKWTRRGATYHLAPCIATFTSRAISGPMATLTSRISLCWVARCAHRCPPMRRTPSRLPPCATAVCAWRSEPFSQSTGATPRRIARHTSIQMMSRAHIARVY